MSEPFSPADASAIAAEVAARAAVRPWLASLPDLRHWLGDHAAAIWRQDGAQKATALLDLLRQTLESLGRGEEAIARRLQVPQAAFDQDRIDTRLAEPRPRPLSPSTRSKQAGQRCNAVLNLGLWNVLRRLHGGAPAAAATLLTQLHARLSAPGRLAPGVSPTLGYAASKGAARFFHDSVKPVLGALAERHDRNGAAYASAVPDQPFACNVPSLAAWSHAWTVAIAGVYLDRLQRHADDDMEQVLRDVWSERSVAVRFRAGNGLTALPTHASDLHLDLWTCAVKAQSMAFDASRWEALAGGIRWHGVRIDMHDLGGKALADNGDQVRVDTGLGVESLYRAVFIDRLQALVAADDHLFDVDASGDAIQHERSIMIELDRLPSGHLPNLRLLLRLRDPRGSELRFADGDPESRLSATQRESLRHWLGTQGDGGTVAHALDPRRIDWRAARPSDRFVDESGVDLLVLGDAAIWNALDPAVQWIDIALAACAGGQWYALPVVVHEHATEADAAAGVRSWLLLRKGERLPAALDARALEQAVHADGMLRWAAHQTGLGAFVMAAVDVDAWQREHNS